MNKKSICLIISGLIIVLLGLFVEIINHKKSEKKSQSTKLEQQMIFEQFVSDKFSTKYFNVEKINSDLLQNYLKISATINNKSAVFYVNTTWHKNYNNNIIKVATKEELQYSKRKFNLLFKVIGIGGSANSPKLLFVIPFDKISQPQMRIEDLNNYKKEKIISDFFFDIKEKTLT